MWFSNVVFPAPRKPVRIVTGRPVGASAITADSLALALAVIDEGVA
jgi:hypothetical protein